MTDHLYALQQEMDGYERGMASMERQMDKMIYEIRDLKQTIVELELELARVRAEGASGDQG
jgi:predicted  nucleic acid-binding Zn-ribbon protein